MSIPPRIGFIGLGIMGRAMAMNLAGSDAGSSPGLNEMMKNIKLLSKDAFSSFHEASLAWIR